MKYRVLISLIVLFFTGVLVKAQHEFPYEMKVDVINEYTTSSGVTIEGVLLQDGIITGDIFGDTSLLNMLAVDTVVEYNYGQGVGIEGALFKDGDITSLYDINVGGDLISTGDVHSLANVVVDDSILTDFITEATAGLGVNIDGVIIQDSTVIADTIFIKDSDTKIYVDGSGNLTFYDAVYGLTTLQDIYSGSTTELISYTSCTYNDTTYIDIGLTTTDVSFTMDYVCERDIGTIKKITGDIKVIYDDTSGEVYYSSKQVPSTTYVDLGVNIQADVDGTDIRLMIIVDNSVSNNLYFNEKIINKFYE